MNRQKKEIEHFLYLYPIAKINIAEIHELLSYSKLSNERINYLKKEKELYSMIVKKVNIWISCLDDLEIEIITLHYFQNYNFEQVKEKLHYKNHSSVLRRIDRIISKIERGMK